MLLRDAPGSGPASPELHRRLRWVVVVVVTAFAALIGRLWQLQVVRGDVYYEQTLSNVVHERFLPSIRGKILDRHGVALADNRPAFNIYVIPGRFAEADAETLVRLLGLSDQEVGRMLQRIADARARRSRAPVLVLEDQGRDRAALIQQASFQLDGVEVRDEPYRHYPNGNMAAHVLGYMNQLRPDEIAQYARLGYEPSERIGRYGLEREWENYLRGKKGSERYVENARGQRVEGEEADRLLQGERMVQPIAGHNLVLTIDAELQRLAEAAAREHPAAGVAVVEVETGRVLALVSTPAFDPNGWSRAEQALLLADPRKPFIDKTLRHHYPPGSTYKFVAAVAALEDGTIGDEEPLACPGYYEQGRRRFRCTSSHGKIDIYQAIQHSCNVYFWRLAERLGIDRMAEVAMDFGFGAPTGLGLNGDVAGRVPTRAWYEQRTSFKIGYTINAAVGQGDVEVTVMQMALAYAALANGGHLYVPQVVERVETAAGEVVVEYEPRLRRRVRMSPETGEVLRQGMVRVVNRLGGTAYEHARSEQVVFAGKTGTAQVRARKPGVEYEGWHPMQHHAWFAGYAPADEPEIAVVVLVEHGGAGGRFAAPVARQIIEGYTELKERPVAGPPTSPAADEDDS